MPADIVAETKRRPVIKGEMGIEVAGSLVAQMHRKNAALTRAVAFHEACRAT